MNAVVEPSTIKDRNGFLGGTDASVIAGCHPYKTARELYHEKRGEIIQPDISDKEVIIWGNVLEDVLATEYSRRTGNKVRKVNRQLLHSEHEFIGGHIDRDVVGLPRALECKTANQYLSGKWGESGSDMVPEHYLLQCQHYMALLPKVEVFDLAVLIGGQDFRVYHIPRDEGLIDSLITLETRFWSDIKEGKEPEFDCDHESTADLMARLYPGTNGGVVDLPDESLHWHEVMESAKAKAKEYNSVVSAAKTHIQTMIGDAAVGKVPGLDGAGYSRKIVTRKGYEVNESQYIDMRFTKKPKGV